MRMLIRLSLKKPVMTLWLNVCLVVVIPAETATEILHIHGFIANSHTE